MADKLVRTKRNGVYKQFHSKAWGSYFSKVDDPLADVDVNLTSFVLQNNFPKIPSNLWTAIVELYFHFASLAKTGLEAQVLLLRDEATLTQWKIVVPRQEVTPAHVTSPDFNHCIDILSGEQYSSFPPPGWLHSGSSHSHHLMTLDSFSATDDANELSTPGTHILVSTINLQKMTYSITASIVLKKTRFILNSNLLLDSTWCPGVSYHPDVLNYIKQEMPKIHQFTTHGFSNKSNWFTNDVPNYADPFSYNTNASSITDVDELYFTGFDNEVEGLLAMGLTPKQLLSRIYKIEDGQWNTMYGAP